MRLPWISIGLLVMLIALSPYAMTFPLPLRDKAADPWHWPRTGLILFGLIAFVFSVVEMVMSVRRQGWKLSVIAPAAAVSIACFVIGWSIMPYWVLGTYQQDIGGQPFRDMDPNSHMPMIWIGYAWWLPILLSFYLPLVLIPGGPVVVALLFWRRHFLSAAITIAGLAIATYFFRRFGDGYMLWFID
jgi:hypothetical protein